MLKLLLATEKALKNTPRNTPLYREREALRNRLASELMFG